MSGRLRRNEIQRSNLWLRGLSLGAALCFTSLLSCESARTSRYYEMRLNCLRNCALDNDDCMLSAQTAPDIQGCDTDNQECTRDCPR
jgi:hypothetical protein